MFCIAWSISFCVTNFETSGISGISCCSIENLPPVGPCDNKVSISSLDINFVKSGCSCGGINDDISSRKPSRKTSTSICGIKLKPPKISLGGGKRI